MVLGAEGAENEFLSEQNLYDAMQGFPLKIKKFPNQRYRQYCRLLYVSGAFGRYADSDAADVDDAGYRRLSWYARHHLLLPGIRRRSGQDRL